MLGIQIRGINHLFKLACDASTALTVFNVYRTSHVSECLIYPTINANNVVVVNKHTSYNRQESNYLRDSIIDKILPSHKNDFMQTVEKFCPNLYTLTSCNSLLLQARGRGFGPLTIVPSSHSFESDYEAFCNANKKVLSSVFGKYISKEDSLAKVLYIICDGNANFMAWACKMVLRNGISIYAIKHFMEFDSEHKTLVKNLDKGNIVALSNCHEVAKSLTDIFHLRAQAVAKQTINWFNPQQKKLLRETLNDNGTIHILNNFNRLSSVKRTNFIRKVSTINDVNEIIKMMSFLCSNTHFEWNKNSFLEFLENVNGLNYEVVHHKGNFIILKVHDYETVKRLGKSTNWCITKNLQYWEQYMGNNKAVPINQKKDSDNRIIISEDFDLSKTEEDRDVYVQRFNQNLTAINTRSNKKTAIQFMAFDFDQKEDSLYSIVGFTATPINGITHAHDFVNNNMLAETRLVAHRIPQAFDITFWTTHNEESDSEKNNESAIQAFLNNHGIDINKLCEYEYTRCNWNKDDVMRVIRYLCHPDDIQILFEDDTKLIIRSYSEHIALLMSSPFSYFDQLEDSRNYENKGCIVYFDFSRPSNDTNKILFWKITEMVKSGIETSDRWFNEAGICRNFPFKTLTDLFDCHGLPFDAIKRPNNIEFKIRQYANSANVDKVFELLGAIPQDKAYQFSVETLKDIQRFFWDMAELKDITFWDKVCNTDLNLLTYFGKGLFLDVIESIFDRIVVESSSCDRVSKDVLYSECKTFSDFIELNQKSEREWNDILNNTTIPSHGKVKRATIYTKTHNVSGYALILDSIIQKLIKDGWDSVYNAVIPRLVNFLYEHNYSNIDASRQRTLFAVLKHFIKDNLIYWRNLTYNDSCSVFKLLSIADYGIITLSKLQTILKTELKIKHISKLVTDLDRYCGSDYTNSRYQSALKLICNAAKEAHVISNTVIQDIVSSRIKQH